MNIQTNTNENNKQLFEDVLTLSKKLIRVHSPADSVAGRDAVITIVKQELEGFLFEEFNHEGFPSLLIRNQKEPTRHFTIILNAHLDIMPGKSDQFDPQEKDGRLYGRGSYDMKATAAVMIVLFRHIAKQLPYPIALQITTDEEITGKHCTKYQLEQGVRSDFVITGECGSNMKIIHKAKGILWIKLHTTGVAAHGAYPWKGDNALWKLHHALDNLKTLFPIPESEDWVTTMNLAKIETTNLRFNHVPDGATAYVDIRFTTEDEKELMQKIKQAITPNIDMEIITHESPETIADDDPYLLQLQQAVTQVTGEKAILAAAHAPSDVRHFNTVGCHGVEFGPIGHGQHEDNEWVDLTSLATYFSVLETFLLEAGKDK